MTRDEAIRAVGEQTQGYSPTPTAIVDALVALGVLKLDDPKPAQWERAFDFWHVFVNVAEWMRAGGYDPAEAVLTIASPHYHDMRRDAHMHRPDQAVMCLSDGAMVDGLRVRFERPPT